MSLNDSAGFPTEACPGEGFCERITGVGDSTWTPQEQFEEASPGCPRKCKRLKAGGGDDESEVDFDEAERNYIVAQIEEMADKAAAGEQLNPKHYQVWQWDLFVYWRKIERDFERNIWVRLGKRVDSFFKE